MPVSTQHERYVELDPEWLMMRDFLAGEVRVKSRGTTYLPKPGGMKAREDATGDTDPYKAFKERAQVPDWIAPAVRAMLGLAFKADPEIELPPRLEVLRESATPDGDSLLDFSRRVLRNVLLTGRYGILPDISEQGTPALVGYRAENIINWREATEAGSKRLVLAVLKEQALDEARIDPFEAHYLDQYRTLELEDGRFVARLWERSENAQGRAVSAAQAHGAGYIITEEREPTVQRSGQPLDHIPLVLVGSTGLDPDPDEIPLLGMANASLAYYRHSASYEHALYLCSQPTPVLTGVDREDLDQITGGVIGSGAVWCLPDPSASAKYLEVTQTGGLSELREAMRNDHMAAVEAGARVMDQSGVESGDARKARQTDQQATLHSCVDTLSRGMVRALRSLAIWNGDDPDRVAFHLPAEFSDPDVDAALITALTGGVSKGATPRSVLYESLRLAKLTSKTDEELDEEIEAEGTSGMGGFGVPGGDGGDESQQRGSE